MRELVIVRILQEIKKPTYHITGWYDADLDDYSFSHMKLSNGKKIVFHNLYGHALDNMTNEELLEIYIYLYGKHLPTG